MAVIKSRWSKPPIIQEKEVAPKPKKNKKVVKKEVVVEPAPVAVEEEMTIEDVLTALEKKSQ